MHITSSKKKEGTKLLRVCALLICLMMLLATFAGCDDSNKTYKAAVDKYGQELADTVQNAAVGDVITFGAYEQDGNTANGKEAIEWIVLEKSDMSLLLASKYVLDCQKYNDPLKDITWEDSTVRAWINDSFLNDAFSADEQNAIPVTAVKPDESTSSRATSGNATEDKVFLLSANEVKQYMATTEQKICTATVYAATKSNHVYVNEETGNVSWWLRSVGCVQNFAAKVDDAGTLCAFGCNVDRDIVGIRPAIWISLQ